MPKIESFETYLDRYEAWFEQYPLVYQAEVQAIRHIIPQHGRGIEIGVGSGLFAAPLGIAAGVEPSVRMAAKAKERGIEVFPGCAESLPVADGMYDYALMVTTICFLDDVEAAYNEIYRILVPGGYCITACVDAESPIGKIYQQHKDEDVFYRDATFYSIDQILAYLANTGFEAPRCVQTLFRWLDQVDENEPIREGYGDGSFVVVRARKP